MFASRTAIAFVLMIVLPGVALADGTEEVVVSASRTAGRPVETKTDKNETTLGSIAKAPASQEQVMAWLANPPKIDRPMADNGLQSDDGAATAGRTIHGSAGVSIGTGGYHSAYVSALIPVGDNGMLGIAISQTDFGNNNVFGYGFGDYGGQGYGDYGYRGGHRGGSSRSLAVSFASDADDLNGADTPEGCAPGFRYGGRYIEPVWVTQLHGNRACDTTFLP